VTTSPDTFDVLVIGAGVGGLSAAARLAHHGYRVLIVERLDRVGGRASSTIEDGFTINTGATLVEYGGVLEETFVLVGAPFEIRVPEPATLFRIQGRDVTVSTDRLGAAITDVIRKGVKLLDSDDNDTTVAEWVSGHTGDQTVRAIFRNLCAGIFALNADELPVRVFMTCFLQKGLWTEFGFSPTGTLGLLQGLADAIADRGGAVWLQSSVTRVHVSDGRVTGATITGPELGKREVEAQVVISNTGPAATVALAGREHFDADYLERMDRDLQPTADFAINIASRKPLMEAPGILTFGATRRLCNMANLTATCPELAPPGWHLCVAWGVPIPAIGEFDEETEVAATLDDLRDNFPGFDRDARILSTRVMRGERPAQHSIPGLDLPRETTIANLWNVGDGVRSYARLGMPACAETAKVVVEQIMQTHRKRGADVAALKGEM
jgi:phytoene dehydrogenase-like protein